MKRLWWAQIRAVIRLELRKTFFAKRGLWIYFVALLPVLLFVGYSIVNSAEARRSVSIARQGNRLLGQGDLQAVKTGMTKEEVIGLLGKPPVDFHWTEGRREGPEESAEVSHEELQYSDGANDLYLGLLDGKVDRINIHEGFSLSRDSVMFASVFQFFFLRLAVFFGCLGIFMNLFRGEVLDRSLHFYFLAPIRREFLVV